MKTERPNITYLKLAGVAPGGGGGVDCADAEVPSRCTVTDNRGWF